MSLNKNVVFIAEPKYLGRARSLNMIFCEVVPFWVGADSAPVQARSVTRANVKDLGGIVAKKKCAAGQLGRLDSGALCTSADSFIRLHQPPARVKLELFTPTLPSSQGVRTLLNAMRKVS